MPPGSERQSQNGVEQARDDPGLLDEMMRDLNAAPRLFRPTNYWAAYEDRLLQMLRESGLKDFRRSRRTALASFGAVDFDDLSVARRFDRLVNNRLARRALGRDRARDVSDALERLLRNPAFDLQAYRRLWVEFVRRQGELSGAVPLEELDISLVGNPAEVFEVDGRRHTRSMLYYYLRYAFVCRHLDLSEAKVVVELGAGSGKQAEILHKLHPQLTLLLFDIPPPLYVGHQYLHAVFPRDVVPYGRARALRIPEDLEPGKIYLFGSWMFPVVGQLPVDLFWNGASLQEMEPEVVENYLSSVRQNTDHIYLMEAMAGKERARRAGKAGVLEPTTIEHYRRFLPEYSMVEQVPALRPDGTTMPGPDYRDTFWSRS